MHPRIALIASTNGQCRLEYISFRVLLFLLLYNILMLFHADLNTGNTKQFFLLSRFYLFPTNQLFYSNSKLPGNRPSAGSSIQFFQKVQHLACLWFLTI